MVQCNFSAKQGVTALFSVLCSTAFSQPLEVDWIYFSDSGSWLSRSQNLHEQVTTVPLPLTNVTEDNFWWQTQKPGSQLIWRSNDQGMLPARGSEVKLNGASDLWRVEDVSHDMLVLKQAEQLRYWPREQWHQLSWPAASYADTFSFELVQQKKQRDRLRYAWWDTAVTAQVHYRLNLAEDESTLVQELIVANPGATDIQSPGYSYSQVAQPKAMIRTVVMAESSSISAPSSSQSYGMPLLASDEPVVLSAGSRQWLPVQSIQLTDVERQYSINWDTRQTGSVSAQASLRLVSDQPMPELAGAVKVPLFNQQLAMMTSFYQPSQSHEATLSLGQSNLVTLQAESRGQNRWLLTLLNRSDDPASISLQLTHWDGKTNRQIPVTETLAAKQSKTFNVTVNSLGRMEVK
jgi:hypothetical protein